MKCFFTLLFLSFFCYTVSTLAQESNIQIKIDERKQELINVDAEFSKLSEVKGVNEAFLALLADDGVLLRPNNLPIEGKSIIKERFFSHSDSSYTLTWKPLFADIAQSGELGYTYGTYEFKTTHPEGNPIIGKGTYVSIWKKDQSGNWKLVLDTGNEGLETSEK